MKQLHTNDISMNNGKLFRKQMVENFEIIQQEDVKDDTNFTQEIKDRQDADDNLQGKINSLNQQVADLKDQVNQLKTDDDDHRKRLERIEKVLFSAQSINAADLSAADDDEHQGYEIADAPVGDYLEEIN